MVSTTRMPQSTKPTDRFGEALQARAQLHLERSNWERHWQDIAEYMAPRAYRYQMTDANRNQQDRQHKIIDPHAVKALRVASAGMMSGFASPSREWFKIGVEGHDERTTATDKWLENVRKKMLNVLASSNFYLVLPNVFRDIVAFGTTAISMFADEEDAVQFTHFPLGSYFIDNNKKLLADMIFHEERRTVRQLVEEYGIDRVSTTTREHWNAGRFSEWRDVFTLTGPNKNASRDDKVQALNPERRPYLQETFEYDTRGGTGESGTSLSIEGFYEFPYLCPRWGTVGQDVYGESPGMDALPEVKSLQELNRQYGLAVEKSINPPLNGPAETQNQTPSVLPGDVNYTTTDGRGLEPVYQVNFDLSAVGQSIGDMRNRISSLLFEDLFTAILNLDRRQITAREIEERHEEKLLQLGPVVERLNDEFFDPLFDRLYAILDRRGDIPEPPEDLQGKSTRIEYISIMSAAQKAFNAGRIERAVGFTGQVAAVKPSVLDVIDADAAVREYMDAIDAPASIRADDEAVEQIREMRAQEAQEQESLERMKLITETTKDLAQSPVNDTNALGAVTGV